MSRSLAEMTAPEVADAIAGGIATVVLPLGSTEQHGAHLPLATDSIRAAALAHGLGDLLPDVLIAPVLPIGCSDEHTGFAGLIGLDHETLAQVVVDCGRRLAGWGVRRLVVLSAHGGNGRALEMARTRLQVAVPEIEVLVVGSSAAMGEALKRIAAADGIAPEAIGLHAGEGETSEMLQLRPDLVRMDRAIAGCAASLADIMPLLRSEGLRAVTPSGTLGDPRDASARRGAAYLAVQIDSLKRTIERAGEPC